MKKLVTITILILSFFATGARADDLMQDFDSLGGNEPLLQKAKNIQGETTISVVQPRILNRNSRFEVAPEFTTVMGGDSYVATTGYGVNIHYHVNPRWSFGGKYLAFSNKLKAEGDSLISDTALIGKNYVPSIDYPKNETVAVLSYYPIYGKMNVLDKGTAHFDVYGNLGYGKIELSRGSTNTTLAGIGLGLWWSKRLSTRAEINYQTYNSQTYSGTQKMELTVAGLQIGYFL